MRRSICFSVWLMSIAVLVLVADISVANATSSPARCSKVVVAGLSHACSLWVHHKRPTTISLNNPVLGTDEPKDWKVNVNVQRGADTIVLHTEKGATKEQIAGTLLVKTRLFTLVIIVALADSLDQVDAAIVIQHKDQLAVFEESVAAKAKELAAERAKRHAQAMAERDKQHARKVAKLAQRIRDLEKKLGEGGRQAVLREIAVGYNRTAIKQATGDGKGVFLSGVEWIQGRQRYLRFAVENREIRNFPVTRVQAFDQGERQDRAGAVQIGEERDGAEGSLGVVPGQSRVTGAVLIRDPDTLGKFVKLVVHGPSDMAPLIRVIPVDPPELTVEERRARRMTMGVRVTGGLYWVADNTGLDEIDVTTYAGLSLRFTKGISELLAGEAEIVYGRTGDASFENATVGGTVGKLSRRGSFGRASFSGLLRFGDRISPYFRLGVGVQGTRYDSQFTSGGTSSDEPKTPFEVATLLTYGAGLDLRGDYFVLGFTMSVAEARGEIFHRSVDAGVHASLAFGP